MKISKRLILGISLLLSLITSKGYGQNQYQSTKVIPPSPTAAALGKYGDMPVSTYTGTPSINIPLYEIKSTALNLPISLSYHASGVKVEEEASWVGLGWSLMAGGAITRSIRGLDDLPVNNGGISSGYPVSSFLPNSSINEVDNTYLLTANQQDRSNDLSFLQSVCAGNIDTDPDIFYFNFAGRSGKFVFEKKPTSTTPLKVQLATQEKISVEVNYDAASSNYKWIITTEDGLKYYFGTTERTMPKSGSSTTEFGGDQSASFSLSNLTVSSWYLDKILAPDGEEINFTYFNTSSVSNGTKSNFSRTQEKRFFLNSAISGGSGTCVDCSGASYTFSSSLNITYDVYLQEINFNNGKIVFEISDREDIESMPNSTKLSQKLSKIIISKKENNTYVPIKTFELGHSYFNNTSSTPYLSKRLKLLSLTEKSGLITKPPYLFEYNNLDLPDKDSKARDHWGYYNGKNNTNIRDNLSANNVPLNTLIPPVTFFNSGSYMYLSGADRNANKDFIKAGILEKITYPTGGSTAFEYEPHDYSNFLAENISQPRTEVIVKYGPDMINPPTSNPIYTLTLTKPTVVTFSVIYACFDDIPCLSEGQEYSSIAGHIQSTGNTPSFFKPIESTVTYENQYSGFFKEFKEYLPAGTYELKVFANHDFYSSMGINWEEESSEKLYTKIGGGVRVSKMIDSDGINNANNIIKKYKYTLTINDSVEISSGVLMSSPIYEYNEMSSNNLSTCGTYYDCYYLTRTSESSVPLGNSAQGNPVGYSWVTILSGENGENGKSDYVYINNEEYQAPPFFPQIPNVVDPENGLLFFAYDYKKKSDGSFYLVREVKKTYKREYSQTKKIKGMKTFGCNFEMVKFYDTFSDWVHPETETIRIYDQNDETKFTETITEYFYNNPAHYQLTKTTQTQSNSSKLITELTYPLDYTSVNSGPIAKMKGAQHIHNAVIEKVVKKQEGTDTKVIAATFTTYQDTDENDTNSSTVLLPSKIQSLRISAPKATFTSSLATGTAADNDYKDDQIIKYYAETGNVKEIKKVNDITVAYLWDYLKTYPIAEVKNAVQVDIAHSSFEADDKGNWDNIPAQGSLGTNLPTGKRYYELSKGAITKANLTASKTYLVSYWSQNATALTSIGGTSSKIKTINGWNLYEHRVTGVTTVSISGTGNIDELRLYPVEAQMTTYTYDPLVGMTSSCDTNNLITYYTYDILGRLSVIKDYNGLIRKKYTYQYANQ